MIKDYEKSVKLEFAMTMHPSKPTSFLGMYCAVRTNSRDVLKALSRRAIYFLKLEI